LEQPKGIDKCDTSLPAPSLVKWWLSNGIIAFDLIVCVAVGVRTYAGLYRMDELKRILAATTVAFALFTLAGVLLRNRLRRYGLVTVWKDLHKPGRIWISKRPQRKD
jgi:hypothetical protein